MLGRLLPLLSLLGLPGQAVHAQYYAVSSDSAASRVAVPEAVVTSFRRLCPVLPPDSVLRWQALDTNSCYGVTIGKHGECGRAAFDSTGIVTEAFLEVPLNALPKPVQRKVRKQILPWLKKTFPGLPTPLRAHVYSVEAEVAYYVLDFYNTVVPRRSRDWLIQPDGNYYPRGSPVFR